MPVTTLISCTPSARVRVCARCARVRLSLALQIRYIVTLPAANPVCVYSCNHNRMMRARPLISRAWQVGILVPLTLGFEKLFIGEGEQCLFIVSSSHVNPTLLVGASPHSVGRCITPLCW